MAQLYSTATEYLANSLTFTRGTVEDILRVGVYHTLDPLEVPAELDFVTVDLVEPGDPLAQGDTVDVLSLIGPGAGAHLALTPGPWQRWVLVKTTTEVIIRKVDVVEVT